MEDSEKLSNPQQTISVLQKYHFHFQKRYGQNFLIDGHVIRKIIQAAELTKADPVLEIGPGIGTLTQYLCEAAGDVTAVELDKNLLPVLQDTLQTYDNVRIRQGDFMKTDCRELMQGREPYKIVANLPYYITTPVIMRIFESHLPVTSVTVMVQREVADRMRAVPGTKDYGALSLAVQFYAEPYLAANVPPNCFMPRPGVGSAVIRLTRREKHGVAVQDESCMFRIIRAAFNQRRKTLVNAVANSPETEYTKETVSAALDSLGLDPEIRGEKLSLEQYAALSDALSRNAEHDTKSGER